MKSKGLKADEVKWTGIEEWLKQQGKVTKADILDYLKNNRVGSNAKDIEVQISWPTEFNGCLAQIDIYFTRNSHDIFQMAEESEEATEQQAEAVDSKRKSRQKRS